MKRLISFVGILFVVAVGFMPMGGTSAQDDPPTRHVTQRFTGYLHPNDVYYYDLLDLAAGETLYISLENHTGNLDPYLTLMTHGNETILMEDDDSGHGYDALIIYAIQDTGDYTLAISNHHDPTFGEYELWIGVNAPEIASGERRVPIGGGLARLDIERSEVSLATQEFIATISDPTMPYEHELTHLNAGHTLYVYLETTRGDLIPHIELKDFARKVLVTGDATISDKHVAFAYEIMETGDHYDLYISSKDGQTTGDFRMLIGIDSPTVLEGHANLGGDPIIREPIEIQVGIELLQVTDVNQKEKNFSVVGVLRATWVDHEYAFDASDCQCREQSYINGQVDSFLATTFGERWPRFHITNQQAPRTLQDRVLTISATGQLNYVEHFNVTLQAPEFDFRAFPFDHQDFWIRLQTSFHDDVYSLAVHENADYNRYSGALGEEEWIINGVTTEVRDIEGYYTFSFDLVVERHSNFYVYRVLLPLFLIVMLGWAIFFIDDCDTRIGASSGNLLIFIAFNFTIGGDLPRLGYLTFLDMVLIICFGVTSFVFGMNVYTKRLETIDKKHLSRRIVRALIVLYPLFYLGSVFVLIQAYL